MTRHARPAKLICLFLCLLFLLSLVSCQKEDFRADNCVAEFLTDAVNAMRRRKSGSIFRRG